MDNVSDGIVPDRSIPIARARKGVVAPSVEDLSTARAEAVPCEYRDPKPAFQGHLEQGRIDLAAVINWHRGEPCSCSCDTTEGQVRAKRCIVTAVALQLVADGGIDEVRQSLLRRALSVCRPSGSVEDVGPEIRYRGASVQPPICIGRIIAMIEQLAKFLSLG
jgi:hypothetical protein